MSIPEVGRRGDILACTEEVVERRRRAEVDDLLLVLAWADSHTGDPCEEPGAPARRRGGPRLVALGGEGTPELVDLCLAELAIARQASEGATRSATADALDLRHRLPLLWERVQALVCEAWVARKIARLSRPLSREAVRVVDRAVADAAGQSPSRLLAIAEAKVVEADQVAHQRRWEENRRCRGVWFPKPQPGEIVDPVDSTAGVRSLFARLDEADALELEQAVDDLATVLAERARDESDDEPTWDQLRAEGLGLLARPADALTLLRGDEASDELGDEPTEERARPTLRRARLVVHLTDTALAGEVAGVARVEGLGPMLREQVAALLRHRAVEVLPVLDLHDVRAVNGYEHPTDVRARTLLRTLGDVFPHSAARPEARVDHDHPCPYDPTGPPAQTGDLNDAPLTRRHHRAKTHLGFRVRQLGPGAYRWETPHGLGRVVTPRGTRRVELLRADFGAVLGEFYPGP